MKKWHHMELSDAKGFGWDGDYMLYETTIVGWNDNEEYRDMEVLVTVRLTMEPDTAERLFDIHFHHEQSETNMHLMRMVDIAIDMLIHDSRVDLDEDVRLHDPLLTKHEFEEIDDEE